MGENLPFAGAYGFGINGHDNALAAKAGGCIAHHIGVGNGGRIERHLIRPRQQQRPHIINCAHTAAHCQRHKAGLGGAGDQIEHGAAILFGGHDIEKTQLIRAGRIIGAGGFHRIARIAQASEVDAFDNAAAGDVKAGDQAGFQHAVILAWRAGREKGAVCPPVAFAAQMLPPKVFAPK